MEKTVAKTYRNSSPHRNRTRKVRSQWPPGLVAYFRVNNLSPRPTLHETWARREILAPKRVCIYRLSEISWDFISVCPGRQKGVCVRAPGRLLLALSTREVSGGGGIILSVHNNYVLFFFFILSSLFLRWSGIFKHGQSILYLIFNSVLDFAKYGIFWALIQLTMEFIIIRVLLLDLYISYQFNCWKIIFSPPRP